MEKLDKQEKLARLEKEYQNLPKGSLSIQTRNGSHYYYRSWREASGVKSEYIGKVSDIDESVINKLKKDLQRGKELSKEIIALRKELRAPKNNDGFSCHVSLGKDDPSLSAFANYKKRFIYSKLMRYLTSPVNSRICALYGLQRSGKTTLMKQAMIELNRRSVKNAYILADHTNKFSDISSDLKKLSEMGVNTVFIDEITACADFINMSDVLPNWYAGSMKIVIAGTDSLAISFASHRGLFDKVQLLNTTYVSYAEYVHLFGRKTIEDYMKREIVLYDQSDIAGNDLYKSTHAYLNDAIIKNIERSLMKTDDMPYEVLQGRVNVADIVYRIVNHNVHQFVLKVMNREFKPADLGSAAETLYKNNGISLEETINMPAISQKVQQALQIEEPKYRSAFITPDMLDQFRYYMSEMNIFAPDNRRVLLSSGSLSKQGEADNILLIPGLRWQIAAESIRNVIDDPAFNDFSEEEKDLILSKIEQSMYGEQVEELVRYDISQFYSFDTKRYLVAKLTANLPDTKYCEYDAAVIDKKEKTICLFEIKHGTIDLTNQKYSDAAGRHLLNQTVSSVLEKSYKIAGRFVLHNGLTKELKNGLRFINISDFLLHMKDYLDLSQQNQIKTITEKIAVGKEQAAAQSSNKDKQKDHSR